jgi:hypothetical protein
MMLWGSTKIFQLHKNLELIKVRTLDLYVKTDQIEDANHHTGKAITLYEAWGASAKSKQLKMEFAKNLTPPSEIQVALEI